MEDRLRDEIERLVGCRVVAFLTPAHQGPDVACGIFLLESKRTIMTVQLLASMRPRPSALDYCQEGRRASRLAAMTNRVLLLAISLLTVLPADALAKAGGGTRSFRSPSFGGPGTRGGGRGFHGPHFFFFPGGGGGGLGFLLLIVIVIVVLFLISRARRSRR